MFSIFFFTYEKILKNNFIIIFLLLIIIFLFLYIRKLIKIFYNIKFLIQEENIKKYEYEKDNKIKQNNIEKMINFILFEQKELQELINKGLDKILCIINKSINEQKDFFYNNMLQLQEKISSVDYAQENITLLANQMLELQSILSNKQTRGAFGQFRMEAIIADALPKNIYKFQATLSNGTRPDCIIRMPNNAPVLIIDSKFPLESWNKMKKEKNLTKKSMAEIQFKKDIDIHIKDIAKKYIISGETQETAFLFIPSESIFFTIYEEFEHILQKANRLHVLIVSPSLLMLSIQIIQSILKDVYLKEKGNLIQSNIIKLKENMDRLYNRVHKLKNHFQQTEKDLSDILISAEKLQKERIKIDNINI